MSVAPDTRGILLCTALAACATVSQALTLSVVLSLQLFVCLLLARSPVNHTAIWLFSAGCGIALLQLSTLTPFTLPIQPLTVAAVILCGAAAAQWGSTPANTLWRTAAAMLLVGFFRELLSNGSVLGVSVFTPPAIQVEGAGALLLAAGGVWLFRLHSPVVLTHDSGAWQTVWLTLSVGAVKSALSHFLPALSPLWVAFITVLCAAVLTEIPLFRTPWAPLVPPLVLCLSATWWQAPAAALAAGLLVSTVAAVWVRWRRRPLRQSFTGAPALLTLSAIGWSVFSAF